MQRSGTTHILFATSGISEVRWQGAVALQLASILTKLSLQAQAHTSSLSSSGFWRGGVSHLEEDPEALQMVGAPSGGTWLI